MTLDITSCFLNNYSKLSLYLEQKSANKLRKIIFSDPIGRYLTHLSYKYFL